MTKNNLLRRLSLEENDFEVLETTETTLIDKQKMGQIPDSFGLCSTCNSFLYRKSELESDEWACSHDYNFHFKKIVPNKSDRVKFCSFHYPRGQMDLYEMYKIALPIDIKKPLGFKLVEDGEE